VIRHLTTRVDAAITEPSPMAKSAEDKGEEGATGVTAAIAAIATIATTARSAPRSRSRSRPR